MNEQAALAVEALRLDIESRTEYIAQTEQYIHEIESGKGERWVNLVMLVLDGTVGIADLDLSELKAKFREMKGRDHGRE